MFFYFGSVANSTSCFDAELQAGWRKEVHLSERNTKLTAALPALYPKNATFLDAKPIQSPLDLKNSTIVETDCPVAKQHSVNFNGDERRMTVPTFLSEHFEVLKTTTSVLLAIKHSLLFETSPGIGENYSRVLSSGECLHRKQAAKRCTFGRLNLNG